MLMQNETAMARIDTIQREIDELRKQLAPELPKIQALRGRGRPPKGVTKAESAVAPIRQRKRLRRTRRQNRIARITIAPGYVLSTRPGTIYTTVCKVLAGSGKLADHDALFEAFSKESSTAAAHQLLQQIGVSRTDIERAVRSDPEHIEHCVRRTKLYQEKAKAGIRRFQQLLKDRRVCDENGNWRGDLSEALSTLYGARRITRLRKSKNLQFINCAGLMFDAMMIGDEQFCFLYPQKWHPAFRHAFRLAKA